MMVTIWETAVDSVPWEQKNWKRKPTVFFGGDINGGEMDGFLVSNQT